MKLSAPIYRLKHQARLHARNTGIQHSHALNQIAESEGFRNWAHLVEAASHESPAQTILKRLSSGEMFLIGARPGQGKSLLALELAALATMQGQEAHVFTLEFTQNEINLHIETLGKGIAAAMCNVTLDTSDEICADYIIDRLRAAPNGTIAVIDYLQILDQRRANPALELQLAALASFATASGVIVVAVSQIDRAFDAENRDIPGFQDVRLPNPANLSLFSQACFLHNGQMRLAMAPEPS